MKICFIWIRREICTDQTLFTSENSPKHGWTFYWRGEALLWARILTRSDILMMDLFLTNMQLFVSQDVNWWTGVVWITCVLLWCFISCLDSHSDGTHSLQMMHWWPSNVMLHFSKSVLMKKETHLHLYFWVTWYSLTRLKRGFVLLTMVIKLR